MKKWIAEILILLMSITSQSYLHGNEKNVPRSGKEIVIEAETSFSVGQYDKFLKQVHQEYQKAGKAGTLRAVYHNAKAALTASPEAKQAMRENYRSKIKLLNEQRNQKLLEAIGENPDLAIVKRVDSIAFHTQPDEDLDLLEEFDSLKLQVPSDAKATIENKVTALEVEYYIKTLLLEAGAHHKKTNADLTKKKIVLHLEKYKKMKDAAEQIDEGEWVQKIQRLRKAYLTDRAYKIDLIALNDLATGKIAVENSVEQKVKEIMMEYLQQKQTLIAQQ